MSKLIDLTGKVFTRWTVLKRSSISPNGNPYWECVCACGTLAIISGGNLRKGLSKSCGCLKAEFLESIRLSQEQKNLNRAIASSIKDKTPKRREDKRLNQRKYVASPKAVLANFKRWCKKRKSPVTITDEQLLELRARPCFKCHKPILGISKGFLLRKPRGPIALDNMDPCCGICSKIKDKEGFDPIKVSVNVLRRFWKKTPMATIAKMKAKDSPGKFKCAKCLNTFVEKETQIDHISPVVEIEGFKDLHTFAKRLFCDDSNLQILCLKCHNEKTLAENELRRQFQKSLRGKNHE